MEKHLLTLPQGVEFPQIGKVTEAKDAPNMPRPRRVERPEPDWVRGHCPECGEDLVSNMYYIGGHGYLIVWECWASLGEEPSCCYRRVL